MVQAEARKGQALLLCQRDAPFKAALVVWPSRNAPLHGSLGWRIGASERRRTLG
jgi:hypothetical protein